MLIEREPTSIARPIIQVKPLAVVLRAARNATGKDSAMAIIVPRVAMCTVSTSGPTITGR